MNQDIIKILVVDDTVTYRKIVSDILGAIDNVNVVGVAPNGKIALQKIHDLQPDIITLDVEMPVMDGLEVLKRLNEQNSKVGAVMLSALTARGADATVEALKLGAFDFVLKPTGDSMEESAIILKKKLIPIINAFARKKNLKSPV